MRVRGVHNKVSDFIDQVISKTILVFGFFVNN